MCLFLWSVRVTHWGRDKIASIFQTTFSIAFSWMKMFKFRLRVHWNLFPRVKLIIFQHWFRWWLGAGQVTSHYLNQWWLVYWRIYASLGLNEIYSVLMLKTEEFSRKCLYRLMYMHFDSDYTSTKHSNGDSTPICLFQAWCRGFVLRTLTFQRHLMV